MAVADALTALEPDVRITALGTHRGLETRLVPERGYDLELITPVPLPRKPSGDLVRLPMRVRRAVRQTRAVLDSVDADVIVGFGDTSRCPHTWQPGAGLAGAGAFPWSCTRPTRVPAGPTGSVRGSAQRVLSAVPDPGLRHVEVVGVPVRAAITSLDRAALRAEARSHFGFSEDARVLLVFGGSQGAQSINRAVAAAAKDLAAAGVSVLHAHGPKNTLDLREPADGDPPYVAVPYLDRMDLAYAAADLAMCRSGAMTVAEVTAVGLPAVYIPLPIGNGEQRLNALPVVNAGGGLLADDADLTRSFVAETIPAILNDGARLQAMTAAAALAGHRDAAQRVAEVAIEVAPQRSKAVAMNAKSLPDELQRVHMVGIGGAGMSGIARILLDRGGLVSGSDAKESRGVVALRARGAAIRIGHDESSLDMLPGGPTAVVTTHAAIPKTNPELVEARRRGIPVILRPVVLAKLMTGHTTLMVTGTHGKTTTTSMLIVALQHSGFDPSFAVGGDLGWRPRRVFPAWAKLLGLDAVIRGIDFPLQAEPGPIARRWPS